MDRQDALAVLQLADGYTADQLAAAYRTQALRRHPDIGGTREAWDELREAYEVLTAWVEIDLTGAAAEAGRPGPLERLREHWRGWARARRLVVTAAAGLVLWPLWLGLSTPYPPLGWQVPAAVTAYVGGWWLYWLVLEWRTPVMVRPTVWTYVIPDAGVGARIADAMNTGQRPAR